MSKHEKDNKNKDKETMIIPSKGFVVYPTYRMVDGKAYVYLFGKLESGESFLVITPNRPYFYIKKKDYIKLEQYLEKKKNTRELVEMHITFEKVSLKNFSDEDVVKVFVTFPNQVPLLREHLDQLEIDYYEADIPFAQRFLIDNDIKGCIEITGTYKKGNFVNRIYEAPTIRGIPNYGVQLKVLSFDLETDMKAERIFSLAYVCGKAKEVFLHTQKHVQGQGDHVTITCFSDEKALITSFFEKIKHHDPDIITGWNVVDFDLNVLRKRCKEHKIPFVLGRAEWESTLRIYDDFFRESKADVAGRQVLDGISLLQNNFVKLDDYKLDTAAREFLGEQKAIQFVNKGAEIEELAEKNPSRLAEYNLKDAELVLRILEKKDLISLAIQRSILTGMVLDRVSASIASFDSLYLRETVKWGYVCPTAKHNEREERIKGGYVMDSLPGIYDYVILCDFKSLYPSIIRTFNIDPLSFHRGGPILAPNKAKFSNEEGILPEMIQRLWAMRDKAKKKHDAVASYAIKITMNSFFGILANPMFRFYSLDMANAITAWGREIVQETAKIVEKEGYRVIYSDTDSIFVESSSQSYAEAEKIGVRIPKIVNEHYREEIEQKYHRISFLELEFEKVYKRFLMPTIRDRSEGAKKRYAGLLVDAQGHEKIEIVGLEFVRRDWTALAKEFQMELLERVFHRKEVFEYVKKFVDDVRKGKKDDLLVYKKAIRKELKEYTKTTPPHVKAARLLGKVEGTVIEYVMTVEGPEPLQALKHALDYDHYIEKQVKPIADALLGFFNQKFEDLITGNKQKSLFEY